LLDSLLQENIAPARREAVQCWEMGRERKLRGGLREA